MRAGLYDLMLEIIHERESGKPQEPEEDQDQLEPMRARLVTAAAALVEQIEWIDELRVKVWLEENTGRRVRSALAST